MGQIKAISEQSIDEAAALIRSSGLVAFPTETVYGLGANALYDEAVLKIYQAKGRPSSNPLIVHIADKSEAVRYAAVSDMAAVLMEQFWPGPLTLVLPLVRGSGLSEHVTAGLGSVALRLPAHPDARALINAAGVPIAAPSANKSGTISPTSPAHVQQSLGDEVDLILAGGACQIGLESTILDCRGDDLVILRPGSYTAKQISKATGITVSMAEESDKIVAPGMMAKHYAPSVPLRLNAIDVKPGEALLAFGSIKFMGVQGGGAVKDLPEGQVRNLSEDGDLYEAASNLYAMLRDLDRTAHTGIAVMQIPNQGLGIAINDRLSRAAA